MAAAANMDVNLVMILRIPNFTDFFSEGADYTVGISGDLVVAGEEVDDGLVVRCFTWNRSGNYFLI